MNMFFPFGFDIWLCVSVIKRKWPPSWYTFNGNYHIPGNFLVLHSQSVFNKRYKLVPWWSSFDSFSFLFPSALFSFYPKTFERQFLASGTNPRFLRVYWAIKSSDPESFFTIRWMRAIKFIPIKLGWNFIQRARNRNILMIGVVPIEIQIFTIYWSRFFLMTNQTYSFSRRVSSTETSRRIYILCWRLWTLRGSVHQSQLGIADRRASSKNIKPMPTPDGAE